MTTGVGGDIKLDRFRKVKTLALGKGLEGQGGCQQVEEMLEQGLRESTGIGREEEVVSSGWSTRYV